MTKKEMMAMVNVAMEKMNPTQCEAVLSICKTFVDIDIKEAETKAKKAETKPVKTGNGNGRKAPEDIKKWLKGEVAKCKNLVTVTWHFTDKKGNPVDAKVNGFKTKKDADKFIKTLPTTRTIDERLPYCFKDQNGNVKYPPKCDFNGFYEAVKIDGGYAVVAKWA